MTLTTSPPACRPPAGPPCPIPPDADFFFATDAEVAEFERWLQETSPWPPPADVADRMAAEAQAAWEAGPGRAADADSPF